MSNRFIWFPLLTLTLFTLHSKAQTFLVGADLSYVNEMDNCGAVYSDAYGTESDAYQIIAKKGARLARIRLWHNPQWTNYSDLADVKKSITLAKAGGMQVMLAIHYSDFWVDPGRQWRPDAWEDIESDSILADSVYAYTKQILTHLSDAALEPDYVQVGNETNGNVLQVRNGAPLDGHSPGLYPVDWSRQTDLLQHGIDAVRDFNDQSGSEIKTIIHIADPNAALDWFTRANENGLAAYDIIGLSYYPQWHELEVREVGDKVAQLKAQFGKEVMVVETGYPWTFDSSSDNAGNILGLDSRLQTYGSSFSTEIQRDFLIELSWLVKENGGLGVIYWEPAWVSTSCSSYWAQGSHWENATFFDFDGKLHAGADYLSYDYSEKPTGLLDQNVTFKVDMTGVDTKNGVFVTGDFTGSPWLLWAMQQAEGNLYELQTTIPGRSEGAYIYYNENSWSESARENVPEACAKKWETHRQYVVRDEAASFHFAWSSCQQDPDPILGFEDRTNHESLMIYPSPASDFLSIKSVEQVKAYSIVDIKGKVLQHDLQAKEEIEVNHLPRGIYFLNILTQQGRQSIKFIKE